jgi:hypothetical protein
MLRSAVVLLVALGCSRKGDPPAITAPWTDNFDRAEVGADYVATADAYRIKRTGTDGELHAQKAYNHPLWLRRKLPTDAVIELDVVSRSPAGDIKVEIWGDGESHALTKGAYTSTGYVFVMGGWNNSRSILAKGDEHASTLPERREPKVQVGQVYHWKIVKQGGKIQWFVDDMTTPFLALDDPSPWQGPGHEYFGFDDWESDVSFDNLSIRPL